MSSLSAERPEHKRGATERSRGLRGAAPSSRARSYPRVPGLMYPPRTFAHRCLLINVVVLAFELQG